MSKLYCGLKPNGKAPMRLLNQASEYGVWAGNQLRDPALFEEDGIVYLLYAVAGESGIGLARVDFE